MNAALANLTPYHLRRVHFLGLRRGPDVTLKLYGISREAEPPAASLVAHALEHALRHRQSSPLSGVVAGVDWSGVARHGLGFLMVHPGREAYFVLYDEWVGENMVRHHVWSAPLDDPLSFESLAATGVTACVWELPILAHERNAWLRHVLTPDGRQDPEAYLADVFVGDL